MSTATLAPSDLRASKSAEEEQADLLQALLRQGIKLNGTLGLVLAEQRSLGVRLDAIDSRLAVVESKADSTARIVEAQSDLLEDVADAVLGPRRRRLNGK